MFRKNTSKRTQKINLFEWTLTTIDTKKERLRLYKTELSRI